MIEQMLLIAKANNIDNLNEDEITNIKHGIAQTFYELIEENKKIPQNRMKEILLTLTKIIAKEQGLNVSVGFRATSAVEMENKSSIPLASHISGEDGEDSKILFSTIYGGFSGIKTYEYLLNDCEDNLHNKHIKIKSIAKVMFLILHELRHEQQDLIIKNTDNFDATKLVMLKERTLLNSNLYSHFHDDFLIEKDADFAAFVLYPKYFKEYLPYINFTDILDPTGELKENLKQSISEHDNTVWSIIRKSITRVKDSVNLQIASGEPVTGRAVKYITTAFGPNLNDSLSKEEIKEAMHNFPQLGFIYNQDGSMKSYTQICKTRDEQIGKLSEDKSPAGQVKLLSYKTLFRSIIDGNSQYKAVDSLIVYILKGEHYSDFYKMILEEEINSLNYIERDQLYDDLIEYFTYKKVKVKKEAIDVFFDYLELLEDINISSITKEKLFELPKNQQPEHKD